MKSKIKLKEGDLHKEFLDVEACNKYEISEKTSFSRNTLYRVKNKENLTVKKAFEILNAAS